MQQKLVPIGVNETRFLVTEPFPILVAYEFHREMDATTLQFIIRGLNFFCGLGREDQPAATEGSANARIVFLGQLL